MLKTAVGTEPARADQAEANPVSPILCLFTGLFFILPCTDTIIKVDMRTISFDIPPQEVSGSLAMAEGSHSLP